MGAGFSISAGTQTSVTIREQAKTSIIIEYNNERIDAPVTETVVERLMKTYNATLSVEVAHHSELPIGVGYGASGAGALGTSLALTSLLNRELDSTKAAQEAHFSEVVNHTGLGDVIAQSYGGLEVRTYPGAPGVGQLINVSYPEDCSVVLAGAPGLETKSVLTNPDSREKINRFGDTLIGDLIRSPSLESIVNASRKFAKAIGLMTTRVSDALTELHLAGFGMSSMVMLGDSVFCFCDTDSLSDVSNILRGFWETHQVITTKISSSGGALIQ